MKKRLLSAAALAALALPFTVRADEGPNTGAVSFSGSVTTTTSYFFRGYNQEDIGYIVQPGLTLGVDLVETDDFTISGYVGTWNSFHSEQTGAGALGGGGGPDSWYEADIYGGIDFSIGNFTIGTVYTFYTYPNDSFETIQEWGFKVAYDDASFWDEQFGLPIALSPYAAVYFETDDGNGSEDTYIELGVTPSYTFKVSDAKIPVAFPVVLGLSGDDYYLDSDGDNEVLGYLSVGANVTYPLTFIPAKYGSFSVTGGVNWIFLFADSAELANDGGTDDEIQGYVTLGWSY